VPIPTDFDEGPPTDPGVADELAEDLAVDGPPDGANEVTPSGAVTDACGLCQLLEVRRLPNGTPPPADREHAWGHTKCCAPWDGTWSWCPLKGKLSVGGVITDYNRRKDARPPPGGIERRRLEPLRPRGQPPPGTPDRRRQG
jgi:hypothetical protein